MSNDRLKAMTDLITPLAASLGLELWGVELGGSGRPVLRIYVERALAADAETANREAAAAANAAAALSGGDDATDGAADGSQDGTSFAQDGTGVSVDQCAELSRLLGLTMDVEDPFAAAWTLEVSSPGLERQFFRLDQLRAYIGRELDLSLLDGHPDWPAAGGAAPRKKFHGVLEAVSDTVFTLRVADDTRKQDDPERVDIPWETVRRVTLVHVFPEPGLPGKGKAAKNAARAAEQEAALSAEDAHRSVGKAKKQRSASGGKA